MVFKPTHTEHARTATQQHKPEPSRASDLLLCLLELVTVLLAPL